MRNKTTAAVLAFFLGIFGIHRFYLGQYERGALHLVVPIILLLLGLWTAELFGDQSVWDIARQNAEIELSARTISLLLPLFIIPLFDTIWFGTRSAEKFNARYNKKQVRWFGEILTSVGYILLSCLLVYWLFDKFLTEHKADVDVPADYTISSQGLAAEFDDDEDAALLKYSDKVILVSGTVGLVSFISGTGEPLLILQGTENCAVNCEFQPEQNSSVEPIVIGQAVSIKGRFEDHMLGEVQLKDCLLMDVGNVVDLPPSIPIDPVLTDSIILQ